MGDDSNKKWTAAELAAKFESITHEPLTPEQLEEMRAYEAGGSVGPAPAIRVGAGMRVYADLDSFIEGIKESAKPNVKAAPASPSEIAPDAARAAQEPWAPTPWGTPIKDGGGFGIVGGTLHAPPDQAKRDDPPKH